MTMRLMAASALAVLCLAGAPAASAADLSGDPYDDPRYGDVYGDPRPPAFAEPAAPPTEEAFPERYSERYDDERTPLPYPSRKPERYSERWEEPRGFACLPRHVIRHRLQGDGWYDFRDLELQGDIAVVNARRPSGRPFELRIDRCTGRIVEARPLGPDHRAYGYGPGRPLRPY